MRRLVTILVLALSGLVVSAAQAQPMAGATCKVEGRERTTALGTVTCVDTPQRGLRWRLTRPTPATTITTTTTVPISTTPQAPTLTLGTAAVCGQLVLSWSGARPDTGWYSVQWTTPNDPNFNRYVMRNVRATTFSMRGFENGGRYLFRVFAMHHDWDGVWHSTENVTPHSNVLEVALSGCTSSATTTTVPVVSCADGGTCAVGDTGPGGGIVFYVHPGGGTFDCGVALTSSCRYLEAATSDQSTGVGWCSDTATELNLNVTAIGTGLRNTTIADATCASGAIQIAADHVGGGETDWYLPSLDELNQLYLQRATVGGFTPNIYWTSSEGGATFAQNQLFTNGNQANYVKTDLYRVRVVRAFGGATACADGGTCAVGDTGPGGGIVFYVHPGGGTFACGPTLAATCRYLEAASTGGTNAWSDAQHQWSPVINTEIGADARSTAIGTGYKNTLAMLAQNSAASYAGSVSRSYRGPFGLSDWYLPSKDELNALFVQRGAAGSFEPAFYATSTEVDATTVWMQAFTNGAQSSLNKANFPYVRPIRAFS
jgi:hypothetical protein